MKKEIMHVGILNPRASRKNLLEGAVSAIQCLKDFERLRVVRKQKRVYRKELFKNINEIKELTGVEIDIEEDGTVYITGENGGANQAKKLIEDMTREYKTGEKFEGEVVRVADFGAIVELNKHTDGLVHISEMAPFRIDRVEKYLRVGMKVPVLIKGVDEKGRLKLSIKDADPGFFNPKSN
ncbi:MAG: S1 RNA-binding domain-containing protein [Nanoarchaeota archaeon]